MILSFLTSSNNIENISFQLIERHSSFLWIPFSVLLLCIILLASIRHYSPNFILFYFKYYKNPSQMNKLLSEEFSIGGLTSFLLIFLFFLSSSVLIFMTTERKNIFTNNIYKNLLLLMPIVLYIWNVGALKFFSWITLKNRVFNEFIKTIIVNNQFIGILQIILLLFWLFNIEHYNNYISLFLVIQFFMWLYIILRNIIISLKNSFSWYYIILYLCTLEILPFYLLYFLVIRFNIIK